MSTEKIMDELNKLNIKEISIGKFLYNKIIKKKGKEKTKDLLKAITKSGVAIEIVDIPQKSENSENNNRIDEGELWLSTQIFTLFEDLIK